MRTSLRYAAAVGTVTLVAVTALSTTAANAATDSADSTATTSVTAGALSISAPGAVPLTAVSPDASSTGTSDDVTVQDLRAGTTPWSATVSWTDFHATTEGLTATIPSTALTYTPNAATTSGTVALAALAPLVGGGGAEQTATTVTGNNTASWTAGLSLAVPRDALAGEYTATITHSVA